MPQRILALGAGAGTPSLTTECVEEDGEVERAYSEFAVVAALNGSILFVGLRAAPESPLQPEIVGTSFCQSPTVEGRQLDLDGAIITDDDGDAIEVPLDDLLTPCPETPAERSRFQCVRDTEEAAAGVVISPGNSSFRIWDLAWEGRLVDATSASRAGAGSLIQETVGTACTAESECPANAVCDLDQGACVRTVFTDLARGFLGLRACRTTGGERCQPDTDPSEIEFAGDIVEIRSTPIGDCSAAPCPGASTLDWRAFERRIVAIEQVEDDLTRLELDRAIQPGCFRGGGVLEYRVRAGDMWTASRLERLEPGQRLGPGGDVGRRRTEMFGVPERVVPALTACERYAADGRVACDDPALSPDDPACVPVMDTVLRRDIEFRVQVSDPFSRFRSGQALDINGRPTGSVAGRMPGSMIVSFVGGPEPLVFVSYSGSDAVLGLVPFEVSTAFDAGRYALLR